MSKRLISICIVGILLCSIYKYAQNEERLRIEEPALDIAALMEEPFGSEIITGIIILETMNNVLSYAAESTPASEPVPEQHQEADDERYNNETVNALGMTMRDDTVLLVKVWKYTSPAYNHVCEEYEYDREGRVLRHIKYYSNAMERWEYEYDSVGNLNRETCYELEDGAVRYWTEYRFEKCGSAYELCRIGSKYGGDGNIVSEAVYNSEDINIKTTYYRENGTAYWAIEYDDAGHQTRLFAYDEQENIVSRRDLEYDAAGNLIRKVHYDCEGNIEDVTEYTYDVAGNLIRSVHYDYESNIANEWEYTYDASGNLLQNIHNGSITKEYAYDSAGNMTKEITDPYRKWKKYEYDSENRIIKMTVQDEDRYEYRYEYRVIGVEEDAG